MGYASREALMEYTQEEKGNRTFMSALGFAEIILGMFLLTQTDSQNIFLSLFFIIGGIFSIVSARNSNSNYKKFLSITASTGELEKILNDFANSRSMADDRIRLGSEYIFGRKRGRPISYAELRKVYPYIVSGTSCARYLKGVTADGAEHILCEFIVRNSQKTPHPDENAIYQHILSRNPNVYLGYK